MTNTRLTDPEILERRYPVILSHFSLAAGTGGEGSYRGGDGVLREMLFRKDLSLSILTERRVLQPYGLGGGGPGAKGLNLLRRREGGETLFLGGKCAIPVTAGDVFSLRTPGGGGWGGGDGKDGDDDGDEPATKKMKRDAFVPKGSVHAYQQTQHSA